jgi:hypothetical protein
MKNNLTKQLISQNPLSQNPGPDYGDDVATLGFPDEVPPGGLDPADPQTLPTAPDLKDGNVLDRPL